ncbi:MAG: restriction endonuclease subunit S, partial [Nanoarchaeota archaeon]
MTKLPDNWKIVKLGDVSEIIMGQSPPSNTYNCENNGLPFYQGKTEFRTRYPKGKICCSSPKKTAKKQDILMSVRAPVGSVNIANMDCCIGRGLCAIRCGDKLDFMYVYHFLKTNEKIISSMGVGSTFTAINKKTIEELKIPIPSIPIQRRIISILEKAEQTKQMR